MLSKGNENLVFIKLQPDEDINVQIKKACKKHDIKTAIVISGIGQLKKTKLGFFKNKGNYAPKIFEKPLELLSLTGNIIYQNNDYFLHLHTVVSDEKKIAYGGHLIEGKISITAEIVLLKNDIDIFRKLNKKTGLQDLSFE